MEQEPAVLSPPPSVRLERRRSGRAAYTNPHLIALLRRQKVPAEAAPVPPEAAEEEGFDTDGRAFFRGVAVALLLVAPFWAAVATACWWWFG